MKHRPAPLARAVLATCLLTLFGAVGNAAADPAPAAPHQLVKAAATVELVFVLDTTGSMGGLLEGAKTKIWSIVNEIMQARSSQNMQVKVGLVAYRDRGDDYVTKVTPLSSNLDEVYSQLMSFRAEGGGDTPEDVRTAMLHALEKVGWSQPGKHSSQIMFLVGDAPPHDDYREVQDTVTTSKKSAPVGHHHQHHSMRQHQGNRHPVARHRAIRRRRIFRH